jgi:hypothetical protein
VSVEAISWALNLAPVPADRGGQSASACKFVLVGLANHSGPDGTGSVTWFRGEETGVLFRSADHEQVRVRALSAES